MNQPESPGRPTRLGVIGTFVWDVIYGRDARSVAVEEWGGIAYALAACDAAMDHKSVLVPLIKVGDDLAPQAKAWMRTLRHVAPDAHPIEVPYRNNRVELRYLDDERRSEVLAGGVPGWTWAGLAPLLRDIDALYVNFISGFEMDLETMQLVRQHFRGPIYGDLHSLTLAVAPSGLRTPQPLLNVESWCRCFDLLQVNEDELGQIAPDGMALAAIAMAAGVKSLVVTLGKRGLIYFLASEFDSLADVKRESPSLASIGPIRTARVPAEHVDSRAIGDPTGCGDVFGVTYFTRLVAGDNFVSALRAANVAAARNVSLRGATALAPYLRGELTQS